MNRLVHAFGDREPLAEIDVAANPSLNNRDRRLLAPLCDELTIKIPLTAPKVHRGAPTPVVDGLAPIGEWRVRHVRKPDWGIGVVVEELDDKLVIEFATAGKKTIRGRELLEDVDDDLD